MVISNTLNYSSLGLGSVHGRGTAAPARQTLTLDAKLNPQAPHEYSVPLTTAADKPKEEQKEQYQKEQFQKAQYTETRKIETSPKTANQNTDPVSRAFLSVADVKPAIYKIDTFV